MDIDKGNKFLLSTEEEFQLKGNPNWTQEDIRLVSSMRDLIALAVDGIGTDAKIRDAYSHTSSNLPKIYSKNETEVPDKIREAEGTIKVKMIERIRSKIKNIEKLIQELIEYSEISEGEPQDAPAFLSIINTIYDKLIEMHEMTSALDLYDETQETIPERNKKSFQLILNLKTKLGKNNAHPPSKNEIDELNKLLLKLIKEFNDEILSTN